MPISLTGSYLRPYNVDLAIVINGSPEGASSGIQLMLAVGFEGKSQWILLCGSAELSSQRPKAVMAMHIYESRDRPL